MNETYQTDILILGAGIGGFETYRSLAAGLKRAGITKKITLVDENNFFTFVPMLHEVISGSIEPSHCTIPLHRIVKAPHTFIRARVDKVYHDKKTVETSAGAITYDKLVVALGSSVNYFGTSGAEHTYTARSLGAALALRHKLVELLEGPSKQVRIAIVGGGFTGVEVGGQIAEFAKKYVAKHYPHKQLFITLIESAPTVLKPLPPIIQKRVTARLEDMGLVVLTSQRVKEIQPGAVILESQTLPADMTVWTAGIRNVAPTFIDTPWITNDRLAVDDTLRVNSNPDMYAAGDIALFKNPGAEWPAPQLGETAHRMGEYVASHIVATYAKKSIKPFRFKSLGTLMPIGDWWGVFMIGKFILFGRIAWWIRRTVYVAFMPGFIYKLKILLDWTLHIFGSRDILTFERNIHNKHM